MKKIFNKKISIAYLFLILPLLFFLLIGYADQIEDIWFLFMHGKYVLSHGIPHTEFMTIHKGLHFVMQQWVFAVVLYSVYHLLGSIGVNMFVGIMNLMILFSLYKLCMLLSKNNKYFSCAVAAITDTLLEFNFILPRPQLVSLLLLIITIYILEDYLLNNSKKVYFLPLISIIFINCHAATWPMLFVFCMPFVAEFVYLYFKKKDKRIFKLLLLMLISIPVALINPYGIEALTYSFNSYGNKYINNLVGEMHKMTLNTENDGFFYNTMMMIFVIILNIAFTIKKHKKYPIHYYFFLFGLSFMAISNLRNLSFLIMGTLPFTVLSFDTKIKYKITIKVYAVLLVLLIIIFGVNCYRGFYTIKNITVNKMVDYLDTHAKKDKVVLYNNYDDGPYFEYNGYKVYMDTRAEVFLKKNNKKEDIFTEYYNVTLGTTNFEKFVNKYNFTHLVVFKGTALDYYLKNSKDYKLVFKQKDRNMYEKIIHQE